jgi:hypothetical protein
MLCCHSVLHIGIQAHSMEIHWLLTKASYNSGSVMKILKVKETEDSCISEDTGDPGRQIRREERAKSSCKSP